MTTHFYRVEFRKGGRDYWRTIAVTVCRVCADHTAGFWKRERPTHDVRVEEYEFDPATIESDAADACPRTMVRVPLVGGGAKYV